jgi:hypothetical protein
MLVGTRGATLPSAVHQSRPTSASDIAAGQVRIPGSIESSCGNRDKRTHLRSGRISLSARVVSAQGTSVV